MIRRIRLPFLHTKARLIKTEIQSGPRKEGTQALANSVQASAPPHVISAGSTPQAGYEYIELKQLVKQQGLLEKQPVYYTFKILLLLGLFLLGVAFLVLVRPLWLQLLNAVYMAVVTTQFGLLGHDAGHRQIFRKTWKNDLLGLIIGDLFIGMSNGWWIGKHNQHHSHPNQSDLDPDIDIPLLSFTGEDISQKGRITRFIIKHQAIFFFPLLLFVALDLQRSGVLFLLKTREKYHMLEVFLLLVHFTAYLGVLFFFLGIWQAVLFILVHQTLSGLYLGSIFAPNHKGMPLIDKESDMSFLYRQVVTARNVKAHPVTDFMYGGLNYQIEHHLFPSLPRNRLKAAQRLIKAFCLEHGIPYYETSVLRSYQEILQYLHRISVSLPEVHTQG